MQVVISSFCQPEQANELFELVLPTLRATGTCTPDGLQIATAHHDGKVRVSFMGPK